MNRHSDPESEQQGLREKLIGLGEESLRKSYYPELQKQLENLRERVALAELVAEISQGLTEERDLRSSLQRCSDVLVARTGAAFVRIWVTGADGEHLELQASSGLHTSIDGRHARLSIRNYPYKIGVIAREKQPLLTNMVRGHHDFHDQQWVRRQGIVAFAGYPLLLQNRLIGVIALFARQPLSNTVLDTLATIANQISISIENHQILDAFKESLVGARESHEKVNGILRSVADALLVINNDLQIIHMNKAAENLLGVSLVTVSSKPIAEVTSDRTLLDYLSRSKPLRSSEQVTDLALFDHSRNEQRIFQARSAALAFSDAESGQVVSLRDVTRDREVERLKSEFITTAAHELRTPLATISGFTELLLEQTWDPPTTHEYLGHILDKTEVLEQIISDLLDLNRIESGQGLALACSEWELRPELEKIVSRCKTEHRDFRFRANLPPLPETVHADQGKILQAIDNLLGNAMKYSAKGSEITLDVECSDDALTIRVIDQGIGMTEEQQARCFEKFYRADTSDTAVGGLGLGLSIVRQTVEAHHGSVRIESQPQRGTTVCLTLPLRPA